MSAQKAVAYFVSIGWAPAQAAGIAANLQAESGFRPGAIGDGGRAYGIAQWHPDRQANFAFAFGKPIKGSTLDEQLEFVDWELRNTEKRAGVALRACLTALEAGACVSRLYERPRDADGEAKKRAALAAKIAADYAPETPADPAANIPGNIPAPEPAPRPAPPPTTQPERKPMLPALIPLILQTLAGALPVVSQIFGPRGEVADRNVKLAQVVVDTVTKATSSVNEQEAAEKVATDAAAAAAANAALAAQPDIKAYLEHIAPIVEKQALYEAQARTDTRGDTNDSVVRRTPSLLSREVIAWMIFGAMILVGLAMLTSMGILAYQLFITKDGKVDALVASLATLAFAAITSMAQAPFRAIFGILFNSDAAASAGAVVDSTRQQLGGKQQ